MYTDWLFLSIAALGFVLYGVVAALLLSPLLGN